MKIRFYLLLGVVAALGLVAWTAPARSQASAANAQTWEYRIVLEGPGQEGMRDLNTLGGQSWELVSVVCTEYSISTGGGTMHCFYYMKRLK